MNEWIPVALALLAASVSCSTQQIAVTVGGYFVAFAATLVLIGGPAPIEPSAAALLVLAVVSTMPSRAGRFWMGVALAGALWPGEGFASLPGLSLTAVGLLCGLLSGSDLDGRIPVARFGVVLLVWLGALTLSELALPTVVVGGPIESLAASRGRTAVIAALACGLCCWPIHTIVLDGCKRGAMAAPAVIPLLGLVTLSRLDVPPAIRTAVVGDAGAIFLIVGLFTLCVGAMLSLAHEDLRFRLVAAQLGLAAWSATLWIEDPSAARVFWATAAVASAVAGSVINRLEFRYRSRERNAFSGLAIRHPTAAVTLGFSAIIVAKVAAGPVAMTTGLPKIATIEPWCVVVVLIATFVYAAAFADVLRELLFGAPRVPEYRGDLFERVGKIGKNPGPLVGPTTLFAWGVPLLFVITISVAPASILRAMNQPVTRTLPAPAPMPIPTLPPPSTPPGPLSPTPEPSPAPTMELNVPSASEPEP